MIKAKNAATGVLVVSGLVMLASEAQTISDQLKAAACGFALWGASWLVWQLWGRIGYLIRKATYCVREVLADEIVLPEEDAA